MLIIEYSDIFSAVAGSFQMKSLLFSLNSLASFLRFPPSFQLFYLPVILSRLPFLILVQDKNKTTKLSDIIIWQRP